MPIGPVEVLVVTFPGSRFNGQLAPALADLVRQGTIRILDLLFVHKEADGTITALELEQLPAEEAAPLADLEGEVGSLLCQEDIAAAAEQLEPGSSAAMLVWENVWAARFAEALRGSGGEVKLNVRIPHAVIEEALAIEASAG